MQNGWKYLHEEWIMKYPFQHAACPELEWYSNANAYDSNYSSQIWIPIIHKPVSYTHLDVYKRQGPFMLPIAPTIEE